MRYIFLLLFLCTQAYAQKTGYANSSDVVTFPFMSEGDYMWYKKIHDGAQRAYTIQGYTVAVTNDGGEALFTVSVAIEDSTGYSTNDKITITQTEYYDNALNGFGFYYYVRIAWNQFKLKETVGGSNIAFIAAENVNHVETGTGNDNTNLSLGKGSNGYAFYQDYLISSDVADLAFSYAYNNHYSNGELKDGGSGSGGYTGEIGSYWWLIFPNDTASVTNDSGDALFTLANHGLSTGYYIYIRSTEYEGYYYVQVLSTSTFKIRDNTASDAIVAYGSDASAPYCHVIGASKMEGLDVAGTSTEPVIITNALGQVRFRKNPTSVTSYGFELWGNCHNCRFTGLFDSVLKTGHEDFQGHKAQYAFRQGTYGVLIQFGNSLTNNPILNWGAGADGRIEVDNIEVDGIGRGFAGIMLKTDSWDWLNPVIHVHDNYVHDTDGEAFYFSNTSDTGQHGTQMFVYNNVTARNGVEQLQFGHIRGPSWMWHNIAFMATTTHLAPFFLGQSNNTQLKVRDSTSLFAYNIMDGMTVNAIIGQGNPDAGDPIYSGNEFKHKKNLALNGRGRFAYQEHADLDEDSIHIVFEDQYVKNINPYDTDRNESQPDYSANEIFLVNGAMKYDMRNGFHIDTVTMGSKLFETGASGEINISRLAYDTLPDPQYIMAGYEYIDVRDVHFWFHTYNSSHPTHPSAAIAYTTDDVVLYRGKHYAVILNHSAAADSTPDVAVSRYSQIVWDSNGKSSLDPAYTSQYSEYPPDDFRLTADSFYALKNIGLFDNPVNTSYTYIYWEWAHDDGGAADTSFIQTLAAPKDKNISKQWILDILGSGNWVRRKIVVKDANGYVSETSTSNWLQIN